MIKSVTSKKFTEAYAYKKIAEVRANVLIRNEKK